ncbi:unnamed protein product, partial [Meganyctiphanes norvegica]
YKYFLLFLNRSKRARFGIKVYFNCPADEKWQGYSWAFEIFYGKESNLAVPPDADHLGKSEKAVVHMMLGLLGTWRQVYADNWFCSLALAEYLYTKRQTYLTGIVREGRGPPQFLQDERLHKKSSSFV